MSGAKVELHEIVGYFFLFFTQYVESPSYFISTSTVIRVLVLFRQRGLFDTMAIKEVSFIYP